MKFLKGLGKFLLSTLIVFSITFIVLSYSVKPLFSNIILKSSTIVTSIAGDELKENLKTGNDVVDKNIDKLLEDKELNALAEKYLDKTLEGLIDEKALDDVNIERDIIEFVQAHEDLIEEKLGIEIKEEYYEEALEQEEFHEITNEYKKAVEEGRKQLPEEYKKVIDYFNFFTTLKCRLILFSILIVSTILLALLQKSYHKWIKSLAISTLSSGIMLFIMSFVLDFIMSYAIKEFSGTSKFSSSVLTKNALITLLSGLVVLVVYSIVNKIVKKKKSVKKESTTVEKVKEEENKEENEDKEDND